MLGYSVWMVSIHDVCACSFAKSVVGFSHPGNELSLQPFDVWLNVLRPYNFYNLIEILSQLNSLIDFKSPRFPADYCRRYK